MRLDNFTSLEENFEFDLDEKLLRVDPQKVNHLLLGFVVY